MYKGLIKAYNDAEKPGISYLIAMPLRILYHFRTCVEHNGKVSCLLKNNTLLYDIFRMKEIYTVNCLCNFHFLHKSYVV